METRRAELPSLMVKGYAALDVMESHLTRHRYFVGGGPTIADISLYAYTHVADEGGFDLSNYPNIKRWLERVEEHSRHILIVDEPKN